MTKRVRTRGSYTNVNTSCSNTLCNGSAGACTAPNIVLLNGTVESISDTPTKGFKERSARGEVIITPYSRSKTSYTSSFDTLSYTYQSGAAPCNACTALSGSAKTVSIKGPQGPLPALGFPVEVNQLADLAILAGTAAMAEVDKPDVMGAVDWAERDKTWRMLSRPVKTYGKWVKRMKQEARRRGYKTVGDMVSQNWLQYRYGIMPLWYSLNGAYKALTKPAPPKRKTARGTASGTPQTTSNSWDYAYNYSTWGYNTTWQTESFNQLSAHAGVLYEVTGAYRLANDFGLQLDDVPSTAWELIPYSFIADWFANFGDWISASTPRAGVNVLGSWTTTKVERRSSRVQSTVSTWRTGGCYNPSGGPGMAEYYTQETIARSPSIRVGLVPRYSTWDFSKSRDQKRVADAFAMAWGATNRRV